MRRYRPDPAEELLLVMMLMKKGSGGGLEKMMNREGNFEKMNSGVLDLWGIFDEIFSVFF